MKVNERVRSYIVKGLALTLLTHGSNVFAQDDAVDETIDEIIVYSTKRGAANIQEVPTSIGLLTQADLEGMGSIDFDNISRTIVGLDVINQGPGRNTVVIRGIHAEGESGSTVVWDNMPTSGAGESASEVGQRQFDLDVYDVQQIEVLRGPQGTLYGANSLTGVVHFVTNKPQMNEVSAEMVGIATDVSQSEDNGWNLRGFVNIPISDDKVAARIAAWHRDDPGFIDAVPLTVGHPPFIFPPVGTIGISAKDINGFERTGVRASLSWLMGDNTDLLLQYIYQTTESHGGPNDRPLDSSAAFLTFPAQGDYNTLKTAHDTADEDITMLGATLTHAFESIGTATVAVSFANKRTDITTDFTGLLYLGGVVIGLPRAVGNEPGCVDPDDPMAVANFWNFPLICYPGAGTDGAFGMAHVQNTDMDLITTEVRLASDSDSNWGYVVGGQVQRRTIDFYGAFEETDPNTGEIFEVTVDNTRMFEREGDFEMDSWGIFGEVTWNMTDALALTVGGRAFGTEKDEGGIIYGNMFEQRGILNPDPSLGEVMDIQYPVAQDRSFYDETASIFKGELSWRVTDDAMLYASISEGYRSGGAINRVLVSMPSSFEHDETLNYELGAKTTWADGRFIANLALFQVDFYDMQYRAPFQNDAFDAQLNCVDKCAESSGAELEMTLNATDNLSFYANFGWNENEILQNLYRPYEDDTLGYAALAGDPLSPQTPEETASAGILYNFQIGKLDSFVRLDYQYTGGMERLNNDRSSDDPRPASDPLGEFSGTIADAELENEIPIPSWSAIHARVGIAGRNWSADLFVRNATDEVAAVHQQHVGVFLGDRTLVQPRTIGLQLRWFYE